MHEVQLVGVRDGNPLFGTWLLKLSIEVAMLVLAAWAFVLRSPLMRKCAIFLDFRSLMCSFLRVASKSVARMY